MKPSVLLLFILLLSCTPKVTTESVGLLNGYWEIVAAVAPNGEERAFNGADEVDFFELNELKGYRKKLKPIGRNRFNNTLDKVDFNIYFSENKCMLKYAKQQHTWEEEIITLTAETLELKDKREVLFRYKKYKK